MSLCWALAEPLLFCPIILFKPPQITEVFDDRCWFTQKFISSVIDEHAPIKEKTPVKKASAFYEKPVKKTCHIKAMLQKQYFNH